MDFSPLAAWYPDVLVRAGRTYPVVVAPLSGRLAGFVHLVDGDAELDPELRTGGAAHLAAMLAERPLFDGTVLCWQSGEHGFAAVPGGYFDLTATCDALRAEYLDRAPAGPIALPELPLRARAHAAAGDPLTSGRGRAAGIGVSVICTVPDGGGRALLLGRRNASVVDSGLWHVAPAGNLERAADSDFEHLAHTVATELAEELGLRLSVADILARGRILGVCHDVLRLRPDVVVRLDLVAGEVVDHLGDGQEYELLRRVPLAEVATLWEELAPETITAPGAGAVALLDLSLRAEAEPVRPGPGA